MALAAAANDVNEKSYILDAKKNFEDVSNIRGMRMSIGNDVGTS